MSPRRLASSQNSQANDDIPPPPEALPPMSTGSNGQGQSSSSRGSSFDDFKKLSPPYFSDTSNPTEAEALIMMIEKILYCSDEQKRIYVRQRGGSLVAHD